MCCEVDAVLTSTQLLRALEGVGEHAQALVLHIVGEAEGAWDLRGLTTAERQRRGGRGGRGAAAGSQQAAGFKQPGVHPYRRHAQRLLASPRRESCGMGAAAAAVRTLLWRELLFSLGATSRRWRQRLHCCCASWWHHGGSLPAPC